MIWIRFKELYKTQIIPLLYKELKCVNVYSVPKILKIIVSVSVVSSEVDSKVFDIVCNNVALITGQKPYLIRAKKSIANFLLRKGMYIACKVTLRKNRMYDFLERLVLIVLPRVRDFKGFSVDSFDGSGNFNFGLKEQIVFPEVGYEQALKVKGIGVNIVTNTISDVQACKLLSSFKLPFINMF